MDLLLLGEISPADATGFWMPAGGNVGTAGAQVFLNTVANSADLFMDTKSSDEDDSAAMVIGNITIASTAAQTYTFDVTDAKDLVRYRLAKNVGGMLHLQFAQPLWQPN